MKIIKIKIMIMIIKIKTINLFFLINSVKYMDIKIVLCNIYLIYILFFYNI